MTDYFSNREKGPRPRTEEIILPVVWGGIVGLVQSLITTGAFGSKYPELCPEGQGPIGTDEKNFSLAVLAEMPGLTWPLPITDLVEEEDYSEWEPYAPDTLLVLDFIEFCYRRVAKPVQGSYHKGYGHYHLGFDEEEGKQTFLEDINRIFSRNSLAFELESTGQVVRLAPTVLRESLTSAYFNTGDLTLDSMLEESRTKFLNPAPSVRREAVERLWHCWERLKSLENPDNKRQSVESLLSKAAADPVFRLVLDNEARSLTDIGNSFHIRHSEVTQSAISDADHFDYLFHRLFSLILLLVSKRGGMP